MPVENTTSRLTESVFKGRSWEHIHLNNHVALPRPLHQQESLAKVGLHNPDRRPETVPSLPCGFSNKTSQSSQKDQHFFGQTIPSKASRSSDLGIVFCPFISESFFFFFFFLSCGISFPSLDQALTTRLPAGPRNWQPASSLSGSFPRPSAWAALTRTLPLPSVTLFPPLARTSFLSGPFPKLGELLDSQSDSASSHPRLPPPLLLD